MGSLPGFTPVLETMDQARWGGDCGPGYAALGALLWERLPSSWESIADPTNSR